MEVEDTGPDPSITENDSLHNNTGAATGSSAAGLTDTLSGILYTMYKQVLTSYLLGEDSTFLVPDHLNDSELSLLSEWKMKNLISISLSELQVTRTISVGPRPQQIN